MRKILKALIVLVLLILSPIVLLALAGVLYIAVRMIGGTGPAAAMHSFITLVKGLAPYFPYLTTIPVVMIVLTLLIKYRNQVREKVREKTRERVQKN